MPQVQGINAIMIYAEDPEALSRWYEAHLGIKTGLNSSDQRYYGDVQDHRANHAIHMGIYPNESREGKAQGPLMINYRVEDLEAFVAELESKGVSVDRRVEESFGTFVYFSDPEGNPIEVWTEKKS